MLLGPVFRAELLRTARRKRYYVMRLLYGVLLLFIIWASYQGTIRGRETVLIDEAAAFALETFIAFAVIQLIVILLLIPPLFGGAIADEKQRKTLHYLMASQLSSFEIVVDKVLGRAPHLAVFLGMGLPVVCLLGLVGGVAPEYVAVAYVGTISTATMAVALTVLISTMARKVRQAVLIAYIFLLAWQFVPIFVFGLGKSPYFFPETFKRIEPIVGWVGATSPLFVYVTTMMRRGGGGGLTALVAEQLAWMVGLQFGAAVLLIWMAVWQLRPTFRRHEATQPRRKWFEGKRTDTRKARPPRWYDRPECGGDAMEWKERHFARTDVFTKLVVLPATVLVTVFLVLAVGIDESLLRAFSDLWNRGLRGWGSGGEDLVDHLRVFSAWYVAIWLLAVAGASASSVAVEREEDTWVSLTSTPLTGWEILRGKALGAVWAQRGFGMVPLGLWTISLLTGSVHPLGFLTAVVAFGLTTWMVAAVGIHASLRANSTSKALASTIGKLVVLYGYPALLFWTLLDSYRWERYYVTFLGLPPRLVVAPLVSYRWFSQAWNEVTTFGVWSNLVNDSTLGLSLMVVYATIAAVLTQRSVARFDRWLDRPAMADDTRAARKPAPFLDEVEPALQS
jgi:ABC-type transport system involved in multi-copper enzyme maturation permease subunit